MSKLNRFSEATLSWTEEFARFDLSRSLICLITSLSSGSISFHRRSAYSQDLMLKSHFHRLRVTRATWTHASCIPARWSRPVIKKSFCCYDLSFYLIPCFLIFELSNLSFNCLEITIVRKSFTIFYKIIR